MSNELNLCARVLVDMARSEQLDEHEVSKVLCRFWPKSDHTHAPTATADKSLAAMIAFSIWKITQRPTPPASFEEIQDQVYRLIRAAR